MTTSNINKIVRGNVSLKPWILSKNTSEIVNTCVQKIYKNIPKALKSAAVELQTKIADSKPENKAPIRLLRSQERIRSVNTTNAPSNGTPQLRRSPNSNLNLLNYMTSKHKNSGLLNFAANSKKLLKTPTFKIYNSRRFGSSASSSSASLLKSSDEKRQQNRNTHIANYLFRSFVTGTQPPISVGAFNYGLSSAVNKYLVPARNQHMENLVDKLPNAIKVSSAIQRDLMLVDSCLKERISLARKHDSKHALDLKKVDPMNGWHHPPPPDLFLARLNERGIANAELQEQHRKLKLAHKMKHYETIRPLQLTRKASNIRISDAYNNTIKEPTNRIIYYHQHNQLRQNNSSERLPSSRRYTGRRTSECRSEGTAPISNQVKQTMTTASAIPASILQPLHNVTVQTPTAPIIKSGKALKSVKGETSLIQKPKPQPQNTVSKATQTPPTINRPVTLKPITIKPIPTLTNSAIGAATNVAPPAHPQIMPKAGSLNIKTHNITGLNALTVSPQVTEQNLTEDLHNESANKQNLKRKFTRPNYSTSESVVVPLSKAVASAKLIPVHRTQTVLNAQALHAAQVAKQALAFRQVPQATATATSTVAAVSNAAQSVNSMTSPIAATLSRFSRTLYFQQNKKF